MTMIVDQISENELKKRGPNIEPWQTIGKLCVMLCQTPLKYCLGLGGWLTLFSYVRICVRSNSNI